MMGTKRGGWREGRTQRTRKGERIQDFHTQILTHWNFNGLTKSSRLNIRSDRCETTNKNINNTDFPMLLHFLFLFAAFTLVVSLILFFLILVACVFRLFLLSARRRRLNIFSTTSLGALFFALKNNIIHICARCAREFIVSNARPRLVISLLFFLPSFFTSSRDLIHQAESIKVDGGARLVVTIFTTRYIVASCTVHFVFSFSCVFFPLRVLGGLTTCAVFSLSCTIFFAHSHMFPRLKFYLSFTVCCFSG